MTYPSLGFLIRSLRTKRKASVRQFAALLGVHHSTLIRYEKGSVTPSRAVMQRLRVIAGVKTTEELVQIALL